MHVDAEADGIVERAPSDAWLPLLGRLPKKCHPRQFLSASQAANSVPHNIIASCWPSHSLPVLSLLQRYRLTTAASGHVATTYTRRLAAPRFQADLLHLTALPRRSCSWRGRTPGASKVHVSAVGAYVNVNATPQVLTAGQVNARVSEPATTPQTSCLLHAPSQGTISEAVDVMGSRSLRSGLSSLGLHEMDTRCTCHVIPRRSGRAFP